MGGGEIRLLGTGTAFHHDGRGSQCVLVRSPSAGELLVDVGPTAMAAAMRFGVETAGIDRVFVTHLHGDHVAGWPFLLLHLAFLDRRSRPLEVLGPVGVRRCLEGLVELCYGDILADTDPGFELRYRELPAQEASGAIREPFVVDVVPMEHHPSSIAYRLHLDGRRIAISGDTRWCDRLERLARGSDLLLLECTSVEPEGPAHVSLAELRAGIGQLGGCEIVLVHLTDDVAAALAADPVPRVTAGHDGLSLPL